jgi:hypothetical protein
MDDRTFYGMEMDPGNFSPLLPYVSYIVAKYRVIRKIRQLYIDIFSLRPKRLVQEVSKNGYLPDDALACSQSGFPGWRFVRNSKTLYCQKVKVCLSVVGKNCSKHIAFVKGYDTITENSHLFNHESHKETQWIVRNANFTAAA